MYIFLLTKKTTLKRKPGNYSKGFILCVKTDKIDLKPTNLKVMDWKKRNKLFTLRWFLRVTRGCCHCSGNKKENKVEVLNSTVVIKNKSLTDSSWACNCARSSLNFSSSALEASRFNNELDKLLSSSESWDIKTNVNTHTELLGFLLFCPYLVGNKVWMRGIILMALVNTRTNFTLSYALLLT